jgi:hypothetical protein
MLSGQAHHGEWCVWEWGQHDGVHQTLALDRAIVILAPSAHKLICHPNVILHPPEKSLRHLDDHGAPSALHAACSVDGVSEAVPTIHAP